MKRMLMTLAAVAGLVVFAGAASADPGGYAPPGGAQAGFMTAGPQESCSSCSKNTFWGYITAKSNKAPDRYGLLPSLRHAFHLGGGSTCKDCNGKGGCNTCNGGAAGGPPPVMQGTLVFPHNPFVRSPRDFFMAEPGR